MKSLDLKSRGFFIYGALCKRSKRPDFQSGFFMNIMGSNPIRTTIGIRLSRLMRRTSPSQGE